MSIRAYSDLYDMIEPYLPGCPIPVVLQHLQWAGREFCTQTQRLTETITVDTVLDQRSYSVKSTYDGGFIKRILEVRTFTADDITNDRYGSMVYPSNYEVIKGGTTVSGQLNVVCNGLPAAAGIYSDNGETANDVTVFAHSDGQHILFCGFIAGGDGVIYYICSLADYTAWKSTGAIPGNSFFTPAPNSSHIATYYPQGSFSGDCVVSEYISILPVTLKLSESESPQESIVGGMRVYATIEPAVKSNWLPEWMFNEHSDAILAGAFWKLYGLPGQQWSSPRDATENHRIFLNTITDAKIDEIVAEQSGALQMGVEGYTP